MTKTVIFDMYETLVTLYESPGYFGGDIARDLGLPTADFRKPWDAAEHDRTVGVITLEGILAGIMEEHRIADPALLKLVTDKRIASKRECFSHLHPEILSMLSALREKGMKLGLISNCFSEEVPLIRESRLFPYFDGVFLSYEQGLAKPDPALFLRCAEALEAAPGECLYVGDGGSHELEAARSLGMGACQAVWYLKEGTGQPVGRLSGFRQLETPLSVVAEACRPIAGTEKGSGI